MENAAYVSPPQLPPQAHLSAAFQAAVTNASTASTQSFQEALMSRMGNMGRPFGLTVRHSLLFLNFEYLYTIQATLDLRNFKPSKLT